jgi:hypothetical protein
MLNSAGIQIIDGPLFMRGWLRPHVSERNLGYMSFLSSRTMGGVE